MITSQARKVLWDISSKTTAYDTVKKLSIIHSDGSVFFFSCCYYEIENSWLFVISEHAEPQMFSIDFEDKKGDCKWMDVTDL